MTLASAVLALTVVPSSLAGQQVGGAPLPLQELRHHAAHQLVAQAVEEGHQVVAATQAREEVHRQVATLVPFFSGLFFAEANQLFKRFQASSFQASLAKPTSFWMLDI